MNKKNIFFNFVAAIFIFAFLSTAQAQVDVEEYPFEVGGQATFVNLSAIEEFVTIQNQTVRFERFGKTVTGIGGRFGYNINKNFAIEAEGNFFPEAHFNNEEIGQKTQFFAGVKAGVRQKHVGAFAKARPGVMTFYELSTFDNCDFSTNISCRSNGQTNFALDLGGVLEIYPTSRTIIRLDVGDTIVRYRSSGGGIFGGVNIPSQTKHNFQASVGFGFRF